MIKSIEVPTWPEIETKIQALPEEVKKRYEGLKEAYEEETARPQPNHEKISSLISEAHRILS